MEALGGCNSRQARQHWGSASGARAHQVMLGTPKVRNTWVFTALRP